MKLIQVDWEGPYKLNNLVSLTDENRDYGLYQIYGRHPAYGPNSLLYIGKADMQTLGKRILQENWWDINDSNTLSIYVGRIAGEIQPDDEWSREIDLAEQLLIFVHKPAYNSKNVASLKEVQFRDIHVLNWGDYMDLLPEVSGLRWTNRLDDRNYQVYELK